MLLSVRDLQKVYPSNGKKQLKALEALSIDVESGQFIAILGPSGCGKSTLLRILAGLESPTSGRIEFQGHSINGPSLDRGLVFQSYGSFPWLSARKNVEFGLKHTGESNSKRAQGVKHVLDLVGLSDFAHALPHELSGGMQQRLAIARSLAMNPKLLLLDEPFGAVDAITRKHLQSSLREIVNDVGSTTILVTHDVEEAILLADRILVMTHRPGSIRFECKDPLLSVPHTERSRDLREFQQLRKSLTFHMENHDLADSFQ